jgi:hypothetical protein
MQVGVPALHPLTAAQLGAFAHAVGVPLQATHLPCGLQRSPESQSLSLRHVVRHAPFAQRKPPQLPGTHAQLPAGRQTSPGSQYLLTEQLVSQRPPPPQTYPPHCPVALPEQLRGRQVCRPVQIELGAQSVLTAQEVAQVPLCAQRKPPHWLSSEQGGATHWLPVQR